MWNSHRERINWFESISSWISQGIMYLCHKNIGWVEYRNLYGWYCVRFINVKSNCANVLCMIFGWLRRCWQMWILCGFYYYDRRHSTAWWKHMVSSLLTFGERPASQSLLSKNLLTSWQSQQGLTSLRMLIRFQLISYFLVKKI